MAIKGYDPVAYFTDGKSTPGQPQFTIRGTNMSGASQARSIETASRPARYAPQFGNFCAMALSLGQVVTADPNNWLISDGKLYVFGKPAPGGPVLFQKYLAENIAKENKNRSLLPTQ